MHYASVKSFAGCGLNITPITIDAHISRGLPQFNIVGQVHASTKESKYRVRAAILNSGFSFPNGNILINLALHIFLKWVAAPILALLSPF